jgi:hypothetical protein
MYDIYPNVLGTGFPGKTNIQRGEQNMLGPSANPIMVVITIAAFFLIAGSLSFIFGKSRS